MAFVRKQHRDVPPGEIRPQFIAADPTIGFAVNLDASAQRNAANPAGPLTDNGSRNTESPGQVDRAAICCF